jgi:hypothetical protein
LWSFYIPFCILPWFWFLFQSLGLGFLLLLLLLYHNLQSLSCNLLILGFKFLTLQFNAFSRVMLVNALLRFLRLIHTDSEKACMEGIIVRVRCGTIDDIPLFVVFMKIVTAFQAISTMCENNLRSARHLRDAVYQRLLEQVC